MILGEERVRRYARLTADFRLVELAKLIHFEKISAENLGYYLEDHPLDKMATPRYVGGIIRSENGEVICDATVVEKMGQIQCKQRTVSYRTEYRGGVEVRIDVAQEDFRPRPSQALSTMRGGILASRPARAQSFGPYQRLFGLWKYKTVAHRDDYAMPPVYRRATQQVAGRHNMVAI